MSRVRSLPIIRSKILLFILCRGYLVAVVFCDRTGRNKVIFVLLRKHAVTIFSTSRSGLMRSGWRFLVSKILNLN